MEHKHHDEEHVSLRDTVVARIKTGQVSMRPRLYFTLQIVAVALTAFAVLLVSIFIFNFILFSIRINSHDVFLSFGPRGIVAFLVFFPWPLLAMDIGLIVLLEWLVRKFRFGYRLPILYLLGAILALTFFAGLALDRATPFNDRLMVRAGGPGLPPPIGMLYRGSERPLHDGICRCVIIAIDGNTLTAESRGLNAGTTTLKIVLPENDPRATTSALAVGDTVFIAGDRDGDTIQAFGVRKIDPNEKFRILIRGKLDQQE